jgi:hypothetical protein
MYWNCGLVMRCGAIAITLERYWCAEMVRTQVYHDRNGQYEGERQGAQLVRGYHPLSVAHYHGQSMILVIACYARN